MTTTPTRSPFSNHPTWNLLRSRGRTTGVIPSISATDCDDSEARAATIAHTTAALGIPSAELAMRTGDPIGSIAVPLARWIGEALRPFAFPAGFSIEQGSIAQGTGHIPVQIFFGNHAPRRSGFEQGAHFVTALLNTPFGLRLIITTPNEGGIDGVAELTFVKHLLQPGDVCTVDHPSLHNTSFRSSRLGWVAWALLHNDPNLELTQFPLDAIPDRPEDAVLWVDSIAGRRRNIKLTICEDDPRFQDVEPGTKFAVTLNGKTHVALYARKLGNGTEGQPLIIAPSSTTHFADGRRFLDLFVVDGYAVDSLAPGNPTSLKVGTPITVTRA